MVLSFIYKSRSLFRSISSVSVNRLILIPSILICISALSVSLSRAAFHSGHNKNNGRNMKVIKNDSYGGKGITITPTSETYSKVVLWFHGLGDTADGWASMMPSLAIADTKFILPTAPTRKITLNHGHPMTGWSDITGLDTDSVEDRDGFDDSSRRIAAIVDGEIAKGIDSSKIVVAGFSQGGALALHYALRSPHRLGGCIALSTWLPFRTDYPASLSATARALPILQVHGDEDMVVRHAWGEGSHQFLKTLISPAPTFVSIEGMGHSSDPEEIAKVKEFILAKTS